MEFDYAMRKLKIGLPMRRQGWPNKEFRILIEGNRYIGYGQSPLEPVVKYLLGPSDVNANDWVPYREEPYKTEKDRSFGFSRALSHLKSGGRVTHVTWASPLGQHPYLVASEYHGIAFVRTIGGCRTPEQWFPAMPLIVGTGWMICDHDE